LEQKMCHSAVPAQEKLDRRACCEVRSNELKGAVWKDGHAFS
jgi:hypothetical protein